MGKMLEEAYKEELFQFLIGNVETIFNLVTYKDPQTKFQFLIGNVETGFLGTLLVCVR